MPSVLQLRKDVPKEIAGIHWLTFGPNSFNVLVPIYANFLDTPACYQDTKTSFYLSMIFWLNKTIALLGDTNYQLYSEQANNFVQDTMTACRNIQLAADQKAQQQNDLSAYLEQINEQYAALYLKNAHALLGKMTIAGSTHMKLRYDLND